MLTYAEIKLIHMVSAGLSLSGFILRGFWMLRESPLLRHRLTRVLPHANDTVLLVAALWLAALSGITPGNSPWLGAKLIGLLGYIVLGATALRFGRNRWQRLAAWLAALMLFAWIVSVAHLHHPAGFFAGLLA